MIIFKQEAFPPKTPAKGAPLQRGRRRRRSGLPGEFTPTAGSSRRAEAGSQMSKAGPLASTLARLLELFVFYEGRVPGFELSAEGFDVPRLEAEGLISRTRNPFDFSRYLMGRALEKFAVLGEERHHSAWNFQCEYPLTSTKEKNMKTNRKIEPCIVQSRQALEAVVADVVKLKLEHAQATAAMEQEIAEVQKRHQEELLALSRQLEAREAGVFVYCQKNRATLFSDRKSLDLLLATVGFELTPPRVEKLNSKDTFGKVAARLANSTWGESYLRYPDPELNKERILADRATLTPQQLHEAGLKIEQDENFFIRPKSEIAGQTVQEAA